jgi:chromosomal replication initiator protein
MSSDSDLIWSQCLQDIKKNISTQTFVTWFKPIKPLALENSELKLQLPSQFFFDFLEGHYKQLMQNSLTNAMGESAHFTYVIKTEKNVPQKMTPAPVKPQLKKITRDCDSCLNLNYTFDNFVEGSSNQFARAAAMAVAKAPGKTSFNPLVIYGGVGLGKTHLAHAIGNYSQTHDPSKRVLFVSSEKFTIEFIESIQRNKTTAFSGTYRNVDILIVDDIHFFVDKERTQEEFFHTFNTLHQSGKQIVMTSDRPPKELKGMEERLISRFQWGLVVDIQPPELETRIAILQRKAEESNIELAFDVISFVASNITSNIRELEGALIRLLARASLQGEDITLELAKNVLKDLGLSKKQVFGIETIQTVVCEHFGIPDDLIRAKTRKKEIVEARQISMFLVKEFTNYSLKTIGLHFGGRDHSTVIHAINSINNKREKNESLNDTLKSLRRKIEMMST